VTRLALALAALAAAPSVCRSADQKQALAALEMQGATVIRDEADPARPVVSVVFNSQKPATGEQIKLLAAFPKLTTVALGGSDKLSDKDLAALAGLKGLETLSLTAAKGVTDDSLKHLAGLKKLKRLDLSLTDVGDAGLKHLAGLKSLESATVTLTKVTDAGAKDLQKALPKVKVIR
jgi:hypothetical protein